MEPRQSAIAACRLPIERFRRSGGRLHRRRHFEDRRAGELRRCDQHGAFGSGRNPGSRRIEFAGWRHIHHIHQLQRHPHDADGDGPDARRDIRVRQPGWRLYQRHLDRDRGRQRRCRRERSAGDAPAGSAKPGRNHNWDDVHLYRRARQRQFRVPPGHGCGHDRQLQPAGRYHRARAFRQRSKRPAIGGADHPTRMATRSSNSATTTASRCPA